MFGWSLLWSVMASDVLLACFVILDTCYAYASSPRKS